VIPTPSSDSTKQEYLNHDACNKEYDGTLVADKIVSDINDLFEEAEWDIRIENKYRRKTGNNPVEQYRSD
jgi:hypothetical protein